MRFILLSAFILFLFSCGEDHLPPASDSLPANSSQWLPDTSKTRLLKIIEGGWVNEEYMQSLRKYQSPMTAALSGLPVQQIAFDISQLEGDTLVNALGRIGYNEDQRFDVVFSRKSDGTIAMQINERKNYITEPILLHYAFEGKDTILLLTLARAENSKTIRFRREFRKFPQVDRVFYTAMEHFVNRELVAGQWKNNGKTVLFDATGSVKNFGGYNRYSITTDERYPASRPDEISFYSDTSGVTFAFTLRKNHLDLYELHDSDDGLEFSRGKLVYSMEKVSAD